MSNQRPVMIDVAASGDLDFLTILRRDIHAHPEEGG